VQALEKNLLGDGVGPDKAASLLSSFLEDCLDGHSADRALASVKMLRSSLESAHPAAPAFPVRRLMDLFDRVECELVGQRSEREKDILDRLDSRTAGLSDLHALFENMFQAADEAHVLLNRELKITDSNPAGRELLGIDREEAAGFNFVNLFDPESSDNLLGLFTETGGTADLATSGGKDIKITVRPATIDGDRLYLVLARDYSRIRELEDKHRNMSVTLKNLIRSVDEEKAALRESLTRTLKIELFPTLEKMTREGRRSVRAVYKQAVADRLLKVIGDPEDEDDPTLLSLTPAEVTVCRHIQIGRCTKEIAELTNSSFETIQTHRKNIRKKLGLTGKKTALYSYLKNMKTLGESRAGQ
jgi:PAS domain S-box-containing protein